MSYWLNLTLFKMGFWLTWALIPIVVEIIPAIISSLRLLRHNAHPRHLESPAKWPVISIIVPVYNSADTLFACLDSIERSTYPKAAIQVIVADNQSTDNSFAVFAAAQNTFQDLHLSIIHTPKGKARALNNALYVAIGTYIINIDSDGVLEPHALTNMILQFENDDHVAALTGTILTQKDRLKQHGHVLQYNEYFEYAQAFLSGRVMESHHNQLFTMSGDFSAFRKEVVLNTFLYDADTIGEDTDMTFQIRDRLNQRVELCPDAIFYIEPIANLGQLYTQRQRWQRGEMEVVQQYTHRLSVRDFFTNFMVRRLLLDHTFLFPRMIWLCASVVLLFFRYSQIMMGMSYVIIYLLYILVSLFNYLCVLQLLVAFPEERRFYRRQWWVATTLPVYSLVCAFIRLVGVLNSMTTTVGWNSTPFRAEWRRIKTVVAHDWRAVRLHRKSARK